MSVSCYRYATCPVCKEKTLDFPIPEVFSSGPLEQSTLEEASELEGQYRSCSTPNCSGGGHIKVDFYVQVVPEYQD